LSREDSTGAENDPAEKFKKKSKCGKKEIDRLLTDVEEMPSAKRETADPSTPRRKHFSVAIAAVDSSRRGLPCFSAKNAEEDVAQRSMRPRLRGGPHCVILSAAAPATLFGSRETGSSTIRTRKDKHREKCVNQRVGI